MNQKPQEGRGVRLQFFAAFLKPTFKYQQYINIDFFSVLTVHPLETLCTQNTSSHARPAMLYHHYFYQLYYCCSTANRRALLYPQYVYYLYYYCSTANQGCTVNTSISCTTTAVQLIRALLYDHFFYQLYYYCSTANQGCTVTTYTGCTTTAVQLIRVLLYPPNFYWLYCNCSTANQGCIGCTTIELGSVVASSIIIQHWDSVILVIVVYFLPTFYFIINETQP